MSLAELKQSFLNLPAEQQHEFVVWLNQFATHYGDLPDQALAQLVAEVWDADDKSELHQAERKRSDRST
jgi:hypothetical protein